MTIQTRQLAEKLIQDALFVGIGDNNSVRQSLQTLMAQIQAKPSLKKDACLSPIIAALRRVTNLEDVEQVAGALRRVQLPEATGQASAARTKKKTPAPR